MAEMEGDLAVAGTSRAWSRLVDQLQRHHLALRDSPAGRAAISKLMDDPRATVRTWSAGHALFWETVKARVTLESIRDANGGLHSLNAKYTLTEFDRGRLHPTWKPPKRR